MPDFLPFGQNDTLPNIRQVISDEDGAAVDLTGATVTFTALNLAGTPVINAAAASVVLPATNGVVEYEPTAALTANNGVYYGRFTVTVGGRTYDAPNDGWLRIIVSGETNAPAAVWNDNAPWSE